MESIGPTPLGLVAAGAGVLILGVLAAMVVVSLRENEPRAAIRALLLTVGLPFPFLVAGFGAYPHQDLVAGTLLAVTGLFLFVLTLPTRAPRFEDDTPTKRFDERDTMFSRNELVPGTERFEEYYARRPEKKPLDDRFRAQPGLLKKRATLFDPFLFPSAQATFDTVERLRPHVDGPVAAERAPVDPAAATHFLHEWAIHLGAVSAGVTGLCDHHLYTHVGRGEEYGKPVTLDHRFAFAFTVEMDREMILHAPLGPTVMESARQYLASGAIAVQMAAFIRSLGYPARAHIDGNYRVVCPLVARDAGLGEIGRMGLLMTPELGPRVRIAVVTTDLPLEPTEVRREPTTIDFCLRCRKCADACPSDAIPLGDRVEIDGVKRWRIDSEACFTFWTRIGTDCARCMRVCPFSHPAGPLHDLVRGGIRNSAAFRALAVRLDDFFYGRLPLPEEPRGWLRAGKQDG